MSPINVLEEDIGDSAWKDERAECLKQVQVTIITQSIISNFRTLDFEVSITAVMTTC